MGRKRTDEYTLECEAESTFADATGLFAGSELVAGIGGLDVSSLMNPVIEDTAYTTDAGSHEGIEGKPYGDISVPCTMHVEGVGAAVTSGAASLTAQGALNAAAMGCTPLLTTGSTASGVPTTTEVVEADDDAHAPDGDYTILPVALGGGVVEARGGTYDAASDTFTALQAFSSAPSAGAALYGGIQLRFVWEWSGAAGYSLGVRLVGKDSAQNRSMRGVVVERSMAAVGPRDVPTWAYALRAAGFGDLFSDTQVLPTLNKRKVFAGSQILLSKFGNTAGLAIQSVRLEFADGNVWIPDEDGNDDDGCVGWVRGKSVPRVILTVPHDQAVPAGFSGSDFRTLKRTGGDESLFHLGTTFGRVPGASFSRYYPKLRLKQWAQATVDELDCQVLTFEPVTGVAEAWVEKHW